MERVNVTGGDAFFGQTDTSVWFDQCQTWSSQKASFRDKSGWLWWSDKILTANVLFILVPFSAPIDTKILVLTPKKLISNSVNPVKSYDPSGFCWNVLMFCSLDFYEMRFYLRCLSFRVAPQLHPYQHHRPAETESNNVGNGFDMSSRDFTTCQSILIRPGFTLFFNYVTKELWNSNNLWFQMSSCSLNWFVQPLLNILLL